MAAADCIAEVKAASGRDMADDELEAIFAELQARTKRRMAAGQDGASAARDAGADLARETRLAAIVEKRNRAINVIRRRALDARVIEGKEAESVRAVLTGVERRDRNSALSVDAMGHGLAGDRLGEMVADLEREGLLKPLLRRNRELDRDIAREIWRLDDPTAGAATGNKIAADIARILHKHQEIVRAMENDAGAWIGKLDHYVTRQSHDLEKIRGRGSKESADADYQAWRDFIVPRLDPKTFEHLKDPAEAEKFLRSTWNALASGLHDSAAGAEWLGGFKGPGNLAKRLSQERKLHFKDADSWLDYNAKFGRGAVVDSIFHGIDKGARNAAMMRVLGTNPEALFGAWVDGLARKARDRSDHKMVDKLRSDWNTKILDVVTRKNSIPERTTLARIGAVTRNLDVLADLGGVVLSSIPDLAVTSAVARHNGVPLLSAYANQFRALLPSGAARKEIAHALGVGVDGILGHVANRFRAGDGPLGKMGKLVQTFHKINGLEWWSDAMKEGLGLSISSRLAYNATKEFGALDSRLQTSLRRYGIEQAEWNAIRRAEMRAADGRDYLLPESMDRLHDDAVAHLAKDEASAKDLGRVRADLRGKLATFFIDQVREGMSEPTAGQRALMTWGARPGTWTGELARLVMQFKSYTLTYMARSLRRELRRDGIDVMGAAHLIVMTTALGYLSMTLKELAKGRNPRDPEKPADYVKLVAAAAAQGGGLGIYGDFLFGDANRLGGGFLSTLAGPGLGTLEEFRHVLTSLRDGQGHPGAEAFQFAKNHTPFVNLFYTRAALDYFVFYRLQEMLNPGYLRRYEDRVKKENAQTFWLRPTSAVH